MIFNLKSSNAPQTIYEFDDAYQFADFFVYYYDDETTHEFKIDDGDYSREFTSADLAYWLWHYFPDAMNEANKNWSESHAI